MTSNPCQAALAAAHERLEVLEQTDARAQAVTDELQRQRDEAAAAAESAELQITSISTEYRALLVEREVGPPIPC